MIGKIILGKSFRGCLGYCLHDKQKQVDETVFKNRAEVVAYNQCFGNDKELIKQFNELRLHNPKLTRPVLHITLSLSPGEYLSQNKLAEIAHDCAEHFGFSNNQFVAVEHTDTHHQHLHIVANRIGFDGRVVSDSNCYKKMADCCRKLELKYGLKQVVSPRRFLKPELRQLPRLDSRKVQLKNDIHQSLQQSKTYDDFKAKMQELNYTVIRGRGIAFIDKQKVYTKGSEVGYSLKTIEKCLEEKLCQQHKESTTPIQQTNKENSSKYTMHQGHRSNRRVEVKASKVLESLLNPVKQSEPISPLLVKRKKQRRKGLRL